MNTYEQGGASADQEPLSQRVARRLRSRMAELQLRGTEVAAAIGMTQGSFSRRYTGSAAWELDELETLEKKVGISIAYLLGWDDPAEGQAPTGTIPKVAPPPPPVTLLGAVPERPAGPPAPPPRLLYTDPSPIRYDRSGWPGTSPASA
ncbi:helix-turn-helix DNA binding domain protein [Arthrobacter phage Aoka]|nr:helix-turn-helix DNA binding domain protein [Arthrobacter phage Aoka]